MFSPLSFSHFIRARALLLIAPAPRLPPHEKIQMLFSSSPSSFLASARLMREGSKPFLTGRPVFMYFTLLSKYSPLFFFFHGEHYYISLFGKYPCGNSGVCVLLVDSSGDTHLASRTIGPLTYPPVPMTISGPKSLIILRAV